MNESKEPQFPTWKPKRYSVSYLFTHSDFKIRYSALFNSSRSFIKRTDVREYIFKRDAYRCIECGSTENLSIDHVVSIYRHAYDKLDYRSLNAESNLSTLCIKCNIAKKP